MVNAVLTAMLLLLTPHMPASAGETGWRLQGLRDDRMVPTRQHLLSRPSNRHQRLMLVRQYRLGNSHVDVRVIIPRRLIWQRELAVITLEVIADKRFYTINADTEPPPGFELYASKVIQARIHHRGRTRYLRRLHWYYFPLLAGDHRFTLPTVRYNSGGRIKLQIFPPKLRLLVRKLPRYIPPLMPVGRVKIDVRQHQRWLDPDNLGFVDIHIHAAGIPARHLPGIDRLLDKQDGLLFLPAEKRYFNRPDSTGIHGHLHYQVPFKTRRSGWSPAPQIVLRWFDPESGRIMTTRTRIPSVFGLAWYWRALGGLLLLVLIVRGGIVIHRRWHDWQIYRRHFNTALDLLSREDTDSLRQALRHIARAEGWPANTGVVTWYRHFRIHHTADDRLAQAITRLSRICYAGEPDDVRNIAASLQDSLRRHRRNPFNCPRARQSAQPG